jgi:hypothetical protein
MHSEIFKHFYNKSVFYLSDRPQTSGLGAIRRMFLRKRWASLEKRAQSRADKDRADSLRVLEKRFTRGDFSEAEYEVMKSMLT